MCVCFVLNVAILGITFHDGVVVSQLLDVHYVLLKTVPLVMVVFFSNIPCFLNASYIACCCDRRLRSQDLPHVSKLAITKGLLSNNLASSSKPFMAVVILWCFVDSHKA